MEYTIDIKRLRKDMEDYYGTAMFNASPMAMMDLANVEQASDEQIVQMAQEQGVDLKKYVIF